MATKVHIVFKYAPNRAQVMPIMAFGIASISNEAKVLHPLKKDLPMVVLKKIKLLYFYIFLIPKIYLFIYIFNP
jgi:hypothetical protein